MKKLLVGLLALGSISTFASYPSKITCKVEDTDKNEVVSLCGVNDSVVGCMMYAKSFEGLTTYIELNHGSGVLLPNDDGTLSPSKDYKIKVSTRNHRYKLNNYIILENQETAGFAELNNFNLELADNYKLSCSIESVSQEEQDKELDEKIKSKF